MKKIIVLTIALALIGASCNKKEIVQTLNQNTENNSIVNEPPTPIPASQETPAPAPSPMPTSKPSPQPLPNPTPTPTPTVTTYTMSEVQAANSLSKCWSVISGKVYNLTSWINQHPGGSRAIMGLCGKDGTSMFMAQHDGDTQPQTKLKSFYIGDLKE